MQALVQDAVLRWKIGTEGHDPKPEVDTDGEMPPQAKHSEGMRLMASHQHSTL